MRRILLASTALVLATAAHAQAVAAFTPNVPTQTLPSGVTRPAIASTDLVYPGCPKPPTTFGNVWTFDPVNGKTPAQYAAMTPPVPFPVAGQPATSAMQGSAAHPWNSVVSLVGAKVNGSLLPIPGYPGLMLSTVFNSGGPVRPGDEVLLMNGNYGALNGGGMSFAASEIINNPPLTIAAAPGQTPVFTQINFAGLSGLVLKDVTVTSHDAGGALVEFSDAGIAGSPNTNIVLENLTVYSDTVATLDTWTQAQWVANMPLFGIDLTGSTGGAGLTCASVTNSHVWGTNQNIALFANNSLAQNNESDHFADDGMDYGASNIAIINALIHDSVDMGNGAHRDGIQGEEPSGPNPAATPGVQPESGIYLTRNTVIAGPTDPANPFPSYIQTIDAYDGDWTNVLAENNIVVGSSCHGIDEESIHNGAILNNTVLDTGIAAFDSGCDPQIIVTTSHEGGESNNVLISGNIAPGVNFDGNDLTTSNNVVYGAEVPAFHFCLTAPNSACTAPGGESVTAGVVAAAQTPTANVLDGKGAANEFTSIVPPYNLALLAGAPGLTAGPSGTPAGAVAPAPPPAPASTLPPAWRSPTIELQAINSNGSVSIIGTATGGSPVTVYDAGSNILGTVTAGSNFVWTFTTPVLSAGAYSFTATEVDPGPTAPSAPSSPLAVTVP
jgi:hypothetical protein